ncbi:MAG: DUF2934 domain-containing protein [Janthinobacterium lividum]
MTVTASTHDSIALRAYFIWNDEGRPQGRHDHHWFSAEAVEVLEAGASEAAVTPLAPAKTAVSAKVATARKPAAAKKPASAKAAAPTAAAKTVVAAAALAAPRAARTTTKGASRTH